MAYVLYGHLRSSATARVRIALALKGLDFELRLVDLYAGEHLTPAYRRDVNPLGQVPTLVDDRIRLSQSIAICEYLDEVHPEPPLLPADPVERARCRQLVEMVNAGIQPLQNTGVLRRIERELDRDTAGWPQFWIRKGFTAMEVVLRDTAGTCCVGDRITLADVVLVPQVNGAVNYGVDLAPYPTLAGIADRLRAIDAFAAVALPPKPATL